jgi:L-asparaginase II
MTPEDATPGSPLRAQYEAAVAALAQAAARQLAAGTDEASVARWAVEQRNLIKQQFRVLTAPAVLLAMEARAQARYGHPVGPTADALHAAGKSWADIIGSACRAGAGPAKWMISS